MGNNNEDKLRALDAALGQIEKQYGKGAVMKPARLHLTKKQRIST